MLLTTTPAASSSSSDAPGGGDDELPWRAVPDDDDIYGSGSFDVGDESAAAATAAAGAAVASSSYAAYTGGAGEELPAFLKSNRRVPQIKDVLKNPVKFASDLSAAVPTGKGPPSAAPPLHSTRSCIHSLLPTYEALFD